MYEAYFHLQKRPFSATSDPACFFSAEPIQELFDELLLRAESGQGIGLLTGAAGTGKTLVCRRIAVELAGRFTPLYLPNANFPTRRALLQSLLFELGRRYSGLEEQELRLAVFAALKELTIAGRGAVLIVDEAHLLNERLLEELRMLASLAEADQPLARVILAGQPSLEERLIAPSLEALNQRVVCQLYLEPLTRRQSIEYVSYRIGWAGGEISRIFTPDALDRIAAACDGLPRCLNQLCDHVLLLTYVQELPRVTAEAVDEALLDLKQLPLHWNTSVAADSPLDALDSPSALENDDSDDRLEFSVAAMDEQCEGPGAGESACFEIGALPPTSRGIVPLSDASPPAIGGFVEEFVDDRYAALDVRSPRFMRTFEDTAVSESWGSVQESIAPAAPEPPAVPLPGGMPPASNETLPLIEDQLEASILDACLEVQSSLGHWHDSSDDSTAMIEPGHGSVTGGDELSNDAAIAQYDVIEPEYNADLPADLLRRSQPQAADSSPGRYVPKPKYRLVFSTLRRRIGQKRKG